MVTEVVLLSRKKVMKNESFTGFSVSRPVYSTRYVRLGPLLKVGVDQETCREVDVMSCTVTRRVTDGTVEMIQRQYITQFLTHSISTCMRYD